MEEHPNVVIDMKDALGKIKELQNFIQILDRYSKVNGHYSLIELKPSE